MSELQLQALLARPRLTGTDAAERIGGRTVLVSGAGGSIGSGLCAAILDAHPRSAIFVDSSEHELHRLSLNLRSHPHAHAVRWVLGDIGDPDLLRRWFAARPEFVFHAAAYKQAPLLESQPLAAMRNNVLATRNLLQAACDHGTQRWVLVSTDKAVHPQGVMGASKRMAELLMLAHGAATPVVTAVRLVNVWGSRGSVLPRFAGQLARGERLTLTDPRSTRFFMHRGEAVQLILDTLELGRGRDILVPEAGPPVAILELARALLRRHGQPDERIEVTGLRPGDKLHETLFRSEEQIESTGVPGVVRVEGPPPRVPSVAAWIGLVERAVREGREPDVMHAIRSAVSDYAADLQPGASIHQPTAG